MMQAILYGLAASSALMIGGAIGARYNVPARLIGALLAFSAGALFSALAFDLFQQGFEDGGPWRVGIALLLGASVFILADSWLDRRVADGATGFALLAAVTLDGVPENLAMGVDLAGSGGVVLLVAIFASNLPESLGGAARMREGGRSPSAVIAIWGGCAVALALAVVVGFGALQGVSPQALSWPRGFAGGAVLASLAATVMPEAYKDGGGPWVAWATAIGFLLTAVLAHTS